MMELYLVNKLKKCSLKLLKISKENAQISDKGELTRIVCEIMDNSAVQIEQYKAGKTNLFDYFVGQVMKNTRGKANPVMTKEIITEELSKR